MGLLIPRPSLLTLVLEHRNSPNAVIFAVASNAARRDQALLNGAHFLLNRPIQASAIRQTLNTAYDLMYKERRRYFRCAAELPVTLFRGLNGNTFEEVSHELGIESQPSADVGTLSQQLTNTKYAGVVLDFDTIDSAVTAVACVRSNRTNPIIANQL